VWPTQGRRKRGPPELITSDSTFRRERTKKRGKQVWWDSAGLLRRQKGVVLERRKEKKEDLWEGLNSLTHLPYRDRRGGRLLLRVHVEESHLKFRRLGSRKSASLENYGGKVTRSINKSPCCALLGRSCRERMKSYEEESKISAQLA